MLKKTNYDFVANRKKYFMVSGIIIAIVLLATLIFGIDLDIEFRGGTILSYGYEGEIDTDAVVDAVETQIDFPVNVAKQQSLLSDLTTIEISFTASQGIDSDTQSNIDNVLATTFPDSNLERLQIESVNANIGFEFLLRCLAAVIFGSILMTIYIALRFKKISGWSAGVTAVIALIHDILIIFGFFVVFRFEIDESFIAVLLTILGYSINDTIVIYDRIRENEKYYNKTKPLNEIVNMSVNQSLARSINTTVSTVLAMLVVSIVAFLTGVTSILSFSIPMIVGLISGTYSSLFIATPLWVIWQEHKAKKLTEKKA